ncbi:MAG: ABC transporter permease [Solirubrobacterales bacterium]
MEIAEAYTLVLLTGLLILFFSVLPASSEVFPTTANLQLIVADQSVNLVIALAVLVPLVTGVWDFTPGATMGLASVAAASVASSSGSILLCVIVAMAIGLAIGLANGVLVVGLRINSVIATLGMTVIIAGVVLLISGGTPVTEGIPPGITSFGRSKLVEIPVVALVALGIAGVVYYVLSHTPYGRYLYSVGSNRLAATLVGLRVGALTLSTYVVGGALSGFAGILQLSRSGSGNPSIGPEFTLPAYAAVFLGAIAIRPGRWNVGGVIVAIFFLACLNSGLQLAGAGPDVNELANGAALLIGVGTANFVGRRRGRAIEMS